MKRLLSGKFGTIAFFLLLIGAGVATAQLAPSWDQAPVISLKAEPIGHIGHTPITNTILASTLVVILFAFFAWAVSRKKNDLSSRFYNFVEMVIEGLLDLVQATVGKNVGKKIFPIIATFLLFILVNNWFGITPIVGSVGIWAEHHVEESADSGHAALVQEAHAETKAAEVPNEKVRPAADEHADAPPAADDEHAAEGAKTGHEGLIFIPLFRSANSDLNMTLAIALISVAFIQVVAVRTVGFKSYLGKYLNFSSPIMFGVGLLEIVSEVVKIFSFAFRLFGNIFAGDVLLIVISSLLPFAGPIPFIAIELFAGMVQALVFAMLSMVFLKSHLSHAEAH